MAYEYENTVVAELTGLGMEYNSNAHYEMADEVKEVYAKAKAFDEILNIDLDQHEIIVHGQVEDIVNKYMEDK
ncbi:isopentenyl transferase family protein [Mammaliicoccus sciuri]|uniref:hypothetical protein n=1 Tax=Mammaliicoccus sciuri TaxID=1296 RepID=UPI002DB5CC64|nr:hypothetical protein [Mammaliicoccus sciuri]MEB6226368.1 isopentenyl transferase family protein [Mammaliicoccus sciuri]